MLKFHVTPSDTGSNLNVYKTFRRHPWRFLNALCTFSLRPMSFGERVEINVLNAVLNMVEVNNKETTPEQRQRHLTWFLCFVNPFHAIDFFLYLLKTSENLWISDVFRGYRKRLMVWNGLIKNKFGTTLSMLIYCFFLFFWTGIFLEDGVIDWLVIFNTKPISSLTHQRIPIKVPINLLKSHHLKPFAMSLIYIWLQILWQSLQLILSKSSLILLDFCHSLIESNVHTVKKKTQEIFHSQ